MENVAILRKFDNKTARAEDIIYLAACFADECNRPMERLLDDICCDDEDIKRVLGDVPERVIDMWTHGECDALLEYVYHNNRLGFAVKFATPVTKPYKESGVLSYSWGHYYTRWVYGDTLDDAFEAGFAWVDEMRKMDRKNAGL